jgi:predicted O-methyltransferase YrrM
MSENKEKRLFKMNNEIDTGFYNFVDKNIYGQSLIHLINLYLPKNSTIVEVGTGAGTTVCMLAQHCPNIKKIYTVDPYIPYTTTWVENNDHFGKKEVDNLKILAKHNIKFSGFQEKIELINLKSDLALSMFDKESIDLLFYDATQSLEITHKDISNWYKKIKTDGIISGHCWNILQDAILNFKKNVDQDIIISVYDDVWAWIKK